MQYSVSIESWPLNDDIFSYRGEKDMLEELKEVICNYVDVEPEDIQEESRFVEDLGFTSYDFMSMVGELEERYDIEVDEREVVNITTVEEAIRYMESLID